MSRYTLVMGGLRILGALALLGVMLFVVAASAVFWVVW